MYFITINDKEQKSACPFYLHYVLRLSSSTIFLYSPSSQRQESGSMASEEFYQRGSEFDSQGQSQQAIAEYTRAIKLDPNHAEAYVFWGNALALEGQLQKGIEDTQKAGRCTIKS